MKTPETTGELRDAAWAVANGMRVVLTLQDRARSLINAIDFAEDRIVGDRVTTPEQVIELISYQRDSLAALVGSDRDD